MPIRIEWVSHFIKNIRRALSAGDFCFGIASPFSEHFDPKVSFSFRNYYLQSAKYEVY